jgi:hypothetical protein
MLSKSWGVQDDDYAECRLLRYKNPVHTLQETYHFSVTELSRLMLCKIWGFFGRDYEGYRLASSLQADSCHSDDRGHTFLRNVGSYNSHPA